MNWWRRAIGRLVWPAAPVARTAGVVVGHEWLAVLGGSDKVAAELAGIANADVVVTFAVADDCLARLDLTVPVETWRFGRWCGQSRRFQRLLPIMPFVWWALDLERADLVITSSHSCVNALRTPHARRVTYCHTPMRYAWAWRLERRRLPAWARPAMGAGAAVLRWRDRRWSERVDTFIANSTFVAARIMSAYGREAIVIPPPVDTTTFSPDPGESVPIRPDAPFVTAGRLVAYKRFDLAIEAANIAAEPLVVAGSGPDLGRLRQLAGPTVDFVVEPSDLELRDLLRAARAFLFCGVEDFGMLPVEAQGCGTPVIARRAGGALDSVIEGETGVLVDTDHVADWAAALTSFDRSSFDPVRIRAWAERFSVLEFRARVTEVLESADRADG